MSAAGESSERSRLVEVVKNLTPRQRTVLSLVLSGKINTAIAKDLDCSLRTVEHDRRRVFDAAKVDNATQLALKLGWYRIADVQGKLLLE
jgi:DNA-binding NarL/FixJ family response regulator